MNKKTFLETAFNMVKVEGEANVPTFYVSKSPLSLKTWNILMKENRKSRYLMWNEFQAFINKLYDMTGISLSFPTQLEWRLVTTKGILSYETIAYKYNYTKDMCIIPYIKGQVYIGRDYIIDDLLESIGCPHESMILYLTTTNIAEEQTLNDEIVELLTTLI